MGDSERKSPLKQWLEERSHEEVVGWWARAMCECPGCKFETEEVTRCGRWGVGHCVQCKPSLTRVGSEAEQHQVFWHCRCYCRRCLAHRNSDEEPVVQNRTRPSQDYAPHDAECTCGRDTCPACYDIPQTIEDQWK
jgi:hypothetical protein